MHEQPEAAPVDVPAAAPEPTLDATQLQERAQNLPLGTLDRLTVTAPLTEDVPCPEVGYTIRLRGATWGEVEALPDELTSREVTRELLILCMEAPRIQELPRDEALAYLQGLPLGVVRRLDEALTTLSGLRGDYVRSAARGFPA